MVTFTVSTHWLLAACFGMLIFQVITIALILEYKAALKTSHSMIARLMQAAFASDKENK